MAASVQSRDFVISVEVACAGCGIVSSMLDAPAQLTQCGRCLEAYCSDACKGRLAETHAISCPRLQAPPNPDWAENVAEFLYTSFQNPLIPAMAAATPEAYYFQLQQTRMLVVLDDEGFVIPGLVMPYARFEADCLPAASLAPVCAEVKAHLVALSGCIPYFDPESFQENSSDITCIVMQQQAGNQRVFLGTVRLHPTIPQQPV